ncbi:hypothetical protein [Amycolatopsis sp. NPDC051061]|uniref:hypothetical protein n=1 Tax=Amycolatopsis sp. NPDC051061 TaxID=3155042 RepID=UPI003412E22F
MTSRRCRPDEDTRRSGRSEFVIARRLAHNHYLGTAVHQWTFCSLTRSIWARQFYDGKIAAGKSHHTALRTLANRRQALQPPSAA